MTPAEIEKEAERIINSTLGTCKCAGCGRGDLGEVVDSLRAVHNAAIEKAAKAIENGYDILAIVKVIRALKIGDLPIEKPVKKSVGKIGDGK